MPAYAINETVINGAAIDGGETPTMPANFDEIPLGPFATREEICVASFFPAPWELSFTELTASWELSFSANIQE